jgi:glycosyltransferase involved in cell wall biosynthesis
MPFKLDNQYTDKQLIHYVPHGIDSTVFKPLEKKDKLIAEKRTQLFGADANKYNFVVFHNSRNIHRKRTSDTILAYRTFCDNLTPEEASKCALVLHTEIVSDAGTDLVAVIESCCPKYKVVIDPHRLTPEQMVAMYNIADVTILISSSEGFGLSIAESIMCGTPVVVNVTGGLQDQIGQVDDNGNPLEFDSEFSTNSIGKYKNHGVWAKPVWPTAHYLQGSPPTPYIFDEVCRWQDAAEALMYWYLTPHEKREQYGAEGRRWALNEGGLSAKNMGEQFIRAVDFTLDNFVPAKSFDVHSTDIFIGHAQPNNNIGVEIPKIDKEKLKHEILNNKIK